MRSRVLVLGKRGRLGAALARHFGATALDRNELDLAASDDTIRRILDAHDFDLLLNAAGLTNVDVCERETAAAERLNHTSVRVLAKACAARGARLVHFSTDYVFAGDAREPYREVDTPRPRSVYGKTKLAGERAALEKCPDAVVARVCWLFGPDKPSFLDHVLAAARGGGSIRAIVDKWSTPTSCDDIAVLLEELLARRAKGGIWHVCSRGETSWFDYAAFALESLRRTGIETVGETLIPTHLAEMTAFIAPRPPYSVLSADRLEGFLGFPLRPWQEAVEAQVRRVVEESRRVDTDAKNGAKLGTRASIRVQARMG